MARIDVLAEEIQFLDHLAPVWRALPERNRGRFMTHYAFLKHAVQSGVKATTPSREGDNPILVASLGDMKRAIAMDRTNIARMEHGIGQSYAGDPGHGIARHGSYAGGDGANRVGLFLVPNEHSANRWRRAYPDARVETIGCPKLDDLPGYEVADPPIIAFSFHWNWYYSPELRSAFEFYQDAIKALAQTHRVVGHAHPKAAPQVSRWFAKHDIPYVDHFSEIAATAAVFVCDNSSSMYEFAATGRPVVVLNVPAGQGEVGYRRSINHGLRFWDAADVGIQVDGPKRLREAVELALLDPPELRAGRERALDIVYAYRSGASARAADALVDWSADLPESIEHVSTSTMTPSERVAAFRETG